MPVRLDHHSCDCLNVAIRDSLMKEVAHGVHKYHLGCSPTKWFAQFFGNKAQIESLLVGMTLYATEPLSKDLSVAVLAAGADFCAATNGVPRCIRPLDMRVQRQVSAPRELRLIGTIFLSFLPEFVGPFVPREQGKVIQWEVLLV